MRENKTLRLSILLGAAVVWLSLATDALPTTLGKDSAQEVTLPEGAGREAANQSCLSCHGAEPIAQQRLTRTQWTAEVDKMIRWGAEVDSGAKDRLIDYLAAHFTVKRIVPPKGGGGDLPEGAGVEIVRDSCVTCHGAEPLVQQRLTRPQWTAEVDKMIRWGAEVPADKKEGLLNYLAEHFPNAR